MSRIDLIVAGTSLGGLAALSTLLRELPADFGPPIAIVQHRSAGDEGLLQRLLQATSRLPVLEPDDKTPIRRGCVYVAPPDYHLLVEGAGRFALSTDRPVVSARPSIDVLFETAAAVYGCAAAGVVLTGASADGAAGLAAIRRAGGLAIVQDPETAEAPTMPASALARAGADLVLPVVEIARELARRCAREQV